MNKGLKKEIFRIIDANFNRSREGLRVCEDISRFILNSPALTKEIKSVRHGISAVAKQLRSSCNILTASRDARNDVGKRPRPRIEVKRLDTADIFAANMERAKESLRVLEEFFKLIDKKDSAKFSALRFEVYEIEKNALKRIEALRNRR